MSSVAEKTESLLTARVLGKLSTAALADRVTTG